MAKELFIFMLSPFMFILFPPFSSLFHPWGFERQTWGFSYADNVALMIGFQKNIPWFTFSWLMERQQAGGVVYCLWCSRAFSYYLTYWKGQGLTNVFIYFHFALILIGRPFLAPSGLSWCWVWHCHALRVLFSGGFFSELFSVDKGS